MYELLEGSFCCAIFLAHEKCLAQRHVYHFLVGVARTAHGLGYSQAKSYIYIYIYLYYQGVGEIAILTDLALPSQH